MPIIARIIWTVGFLIGTITHSLDLYHGGWLPYDFRPLPWNIYWTSLTFLDPLAAVLIWVRERWGVWLGVAIMASNLLVKAKGVALEDGYQGEKIKVKTNSTKKTLEGILVSANEVEVKLK